MRFHTHGQEAESLASKTLVVPQLQCAVLGTSLNAQDTSDRIENSFVLFSCRRPPARSPKVTHVPRQSFPGATSWSSHHVFPAERGCAAVRWPFDSRTRGLRPGAPHPPRCTCKPRLRSSPQPPRPPAPISRSSPPAARGARGSVALTGTSLTLRILHSGRDQRSRSARLLQRPRPPRRSL